MNADLLLQHFDRLSEAPDAIPRLRRFILDLAVRGKLVPQDPNDEPATELLKRIQKGKERLVRAGTIKKPAPLPPIDAATLPFVSPRHWAWLQLDGIGVLSGGMTPSKNRSEYWEGDVNWFSPKDIKSDELYNSELKITLKGAMETGLQIYPLGCLFIVARSGILKRTFPVSINRVKAAVNQDLKVLNPFIPGIERYLQIMFWGMTDFILSSLVKTGTTVQSLKYEEFESQPFPLPPLAEQHRIVAKVDELMALCDQLQAAQTQREHTRDQLVSSSLQALTAVKEPPEPAVPGKFAKTKPAKTQTASVLPAGVVFLNHLPQLPTRSAHIKQLRQTILNLAVRGNLVPQDPNDEPASELLRRIGKEKERLVREKKIRKEKPIAPANSEDLELAIRPGWQVARIGQILLELQTGPFGSSLHQSDYQKGGIPVINPASIKDERLVPIDSMAIGKATLERLATFKLRAGDIVMGRRGEMGRCAVVTKHEEGWLCGTGSLILRLPSGVFSRFFVTLIGSPFVRDYLGGSAVGATMQNLNQSILLKLVIGLPPLAEQHRIVAKVDELMALCDHLENQFDSIEIDSGRLLETILCEVRGA